MRLKVWIRGAGLQWVTTHRRGSACLVCKVKAKTKAAYWGTFTVALMQNLKFLFYTVKVARSQDLIWSVVPSSQAENKDCGCSFAILPQSVVQPAQSVSPHHHGTSAMFKHCDPRQSKHPHWYINAANLLYYLKYFYNFWHICVFSRFYNPFLLPVLGCQGAVDEHKVCFF